MIEFERQELYGYDIYSFNCDGEEVCISFFREIEDLNVVSAVIFAEKAERLTKHHDPRFIDVMGRIRNDFDPEDEFQYHVAAH